MEVDIFHTRDKVSINTALAVLFSFNSHCLFNTSMGVGRGTINIKSKF